MAKESQAPQVSLTGPEKAVLLLLSLDEAAAASIVSELGPEEIRRLREVAGDMKSVPSSALDHVYDEFVKRSHFAVAVPRGGLHYLRKLSSRALGEAATQDIFEDSPPTALARISTTDPTTLAALLESEHPQLIAAVLSQLSPERAAQVLEALPEEVRATALKRLGALTEIPTGLLEEVATALLSELPHVDPLRAIPVNGVKHSAQLVRNLSKDVCEALLSDVEADNHALATEIRRAMYSFEDLKLIEPRSMRELLKAVPGDRLLLAMKTASDTMKAHIFSGMSKRAAERMLEDLDMLGAVRLSEVEDAQLEIVEIALRLEAEGALSLGGDGEPLV